MKKVIKNLRYFVPLLFKLNPFSVIAMVLDGALTGLTSICYVIFPKFIIDILVSNGSRKELAVMILWFVLVILGLWLLNYLTGLFLNYFTTKARFMLDEMFNNKVAEIDYYLYEDPKFNEEMNFAKDSMTKYTNGIYSIVYLIRNTIEKLVAISGVIAIIIAFHNPFLLLFLIVNLVVAYIVATGYQKAEFVLNKKWNSNRLKEWYFNQSMMAFPNQKALRVYDVSPIIKEKSTYYNDIAFAYNKEYETKLLKIGLLESSNSYLLHGLVCVFLILSALDGKITLSEFTVLFNAIFVLQGSFESMIYSIKKYMKDCEYLDHYINFMNRESIYKEGKIVIDKISTVEFRNVWFKYPRSDHNILEDVSFIIDANKKISLIGINGAGKTTIIKLLCRFYSVDKGVILINGIDISKIDEVSLLKNLAIVFQDFKIISFNIKENIEIDKDDKAHLDDVLRKSMIYERVQELDKKEYTYINKWFDKEGITFSGGELQKFAFSRSLYKDGSFVILDEPTSALDPESEAKIYYDFKEIVGNKPTIYISHRLSSCIFSDVIIVLDGKKIVQVGNHESLIKDKNGLYYQMFSAQSEYYEDNE